MTDPWLQRWLPLVRERAGGTPVLEIGCGPGADTSVLVRAGLEVIAFDRSAAAVALAKSRAPSARIECRDVRGAWPEAAAGFGVIVASLSLHYFPWPETLALVARIHAALRARGMLLCRLNSTEDHHFGASGHPAIEPNYYLVDGEPKRFFDERAIDELFPNGWRRLSVEHMTTRKYLKRKALWEVVVERTG